MFVSAVLLLFLVKQRWRKGGASSLRWSISNRSLINILYSELQFGCQAPVELLIESCVTWSIWPSARWRRFGAANSSFLGGKILANKTFKGLKLTNSDFFIATHWDESKKKLLQIHFKQATVYETRMDTGIEQIQDISLSPTFKLIVSTSEKILNIMCVVVWRQVK